MNNIRQYFTSPTKETPPIKLQNKIVSSTPKLFNELPNTSKVAKESDMSEKTSKNKLIISNMESVIHSVKKKHIKKYKNKKHRKKSKAQEETEIMDISNILNSSLKFVSPSSSKNNEENESSNLKEEEKNGQSRKIPQKAEKQDKIGIKKSAIKLQNGDSPKRKNRSSKSLPLAALESSVQMNYSDVLETSIEKNETISKRNAFEVMMNARNKVIGSNSAGIDLSATDLDWISPSNNSKSKRKEMLSAWAEQKGAKKRRVQEENIDEHIKNEMNKRAKRLKRMLTKNESNSSTDDSQQTHKLKKLPDKARKNKIAKTTKSLEVDENINKLNSGSTKIDDLELKLTKKLSPIEANGNRKVGRPRKKLFELAIETVEFPVNLIPKEEKTNINDIKLLEKKSPGKMVQDSPSSRPRRACRSKTISYDFDIEISPTQLIEKKSLTHAKNLLNKQTIKDLHIIEVDNISPKKICKTEIEPNTVTRKTKKPIKLAPLFMKTTPVPKPVIDASLVKARQDFLMSGIPEKMKVEIAKQKEFEENFELNLFPIISHISQFSDEENERIARNSVITNSNILLKDDITYYEDPTNRKWIFKSGTLTDCCLKKIKRKSVTKELIPIEILNKDEQKIIARGLKIKFNNFPTYKCYKMLSKKYDDVRMNQERINSHFIDIKVEKRSSLNKKQNSKNGQKSFSSSSCLNSSVEIVEEIINCRKEDTLFTEKYKPIVPEQVLVNSSSVFELKKILTNWPFDNRRATLDRSYDSADDFEHCNDSNTSLFAGQQSMSRSSILLLGSCGTGKTNAVYGIANEMNFNVLEINAGSKRNGKKILQDLQEATQSHKVQMKEDTGSQLLRNSVKKLKRNDSSENSRGSGSGESLSQQMSLILIEDADIIFEQDDGFINAINQLMVTSKRPVIMTANDENCDHLLKYMSQNCIQFPLAKSREIAKWLTIMALVEGIYIDHLDIEQLFRHNKCDIRKTILEMQFFIQSGGDRFRKNISDYDRSQSDIKCQQLDGDNCDNLIEDECSRLSWSEIGNQKFEEIYKHRDLIHCLIKNDSIAFDILSMNTPIALQSSPNHKKSKKGTEQKSLSNWSIFYENLSFAENFSKSEADDDLSVNLGREISQQIAKYTLSQSEEWFNCGWDKMDRFKTTTTDKLTPLMTSLNPTNLRKKSINLDYEPILRTICRSEQNRLQCERKNSRFYHYLRNFMPYTLGHEEFEKYSLVFSQQME